jgi:hypothetical protein
VDYRVLTDEAAPWGEAANNLLNRSKNDVLFMDDDIELLPKSIPPKPILDWLAGDASIIGFMLRDPNNVGKVPQGPYNCVVAGDRIDPVPATSGGAMLKPVYCAHVTASLLYIKRQAIDANLRFPVWDGSHYEDVAFTLSAWMHGFKVAYIPMLAHHLMSGAGGATKGVDPAFDERRMKNHQTFQDWCVVCGVGRSIGSTIPAQVAEIGNDGSLEFAL